MHIRPSQEAETALFSEWPDVFDLSLIEVQPLLAIQSSECTDVLHGNIRQVQLGENNESSEWTDFLHLRIRKAKSSYVTPNLLAAVMIKPSP